MGICIDAFPLDEDEFGHLACDGRNCDRPEHGPFCPTCSGVGCDMCYGTGHLSEEIIRADG